MKTTIILLSSTLLLIIVLLMSKERDSPKETSLNFSISSSEKDTFQLVAQEVADGYVRSLTFTSWSMELSQWISKHEYKGAVDTFQEVDWSQWEFEKYCFKTRIQEKARSVEYSFFDNGDYSNPKATLQQVVIFDRRTKRNEELDQRIWEIISDSLTKRYGAPSAVPADDMLSPFDLGAMRNQREPRFWQDGVERIVLAEHFRWEGKVRTDFIVILSREKALDSLVHQCQEIEQNYNNTTFREAALTSEICDSLRLTKTPLNFSCQPDTSRKSQLNHLLRCGEFISKAERSRDSAYLPLYLMALYVFGQSYSPQGNGDGAGPWRDVDTLKHYNIIFEWSHLGEGWEYSKQPLINIYSKYSNNHWGQLAFTMLQNTGWCLDGMCNGNNGPKVVSRGEEFLNNHPKSIFTTAILLTIAKGYETNWNVSTCETESPYMYDPNYRSDQDSRIKAITTYERILALDSTSTEAKIAKLRLSRLKLGINTGRTDYFFIYD